MSLLFAAMVGWMMLGPLGCSSGPSDDPPDPPSDPEIMVDVAFPNLTFTRPVDLQSPGDGTNRLFVVEQAGTIRVFENDASASSSEVFLDIQDRVRNAGNEEGLLGLAFHPDFADNGFFYVDYTASNPQRTVIARYEVDPSNPDRAVRDSETVLLEVDQPFSNHNGGQIRFGPDGFLYIALGDGGSAGDPRGNGQDPSTLLGSILRIDVDNPSEGRPYGIPADNPFAGNEEGRDEIYAYGLRNPWRFSFDAETGQLWAGDVGQNDFEEVDVIESGGNYGWNVMEGRHCFSPSTGCDQTDLLLPIQEYSHDQGRSITGGFVYRGSAVPELQDWYIYADFVSGRIWRLQHEDGEAVDNELLRTTSLNISSFGVDAEDELYFCTFDGQIYRFVAP